ncbi:iron-containing redox enzyme family protein [Streptomyces sp. NPDC093109]|uniref:iron-containing redox enzyme family protein n=1 Tax=Streptomyces sp. NPDC093109 TaxID=3154977 RepID=UPI00344BDDDC
MTTTGHGLGHVHGHGRETRRTGCAGLLRAKIELTMPEFRAVSGRLWNGPSVAELYPDYLCVLHSMVRSTVPLMEAALDRSRALAAEGDPVAEVLVPYWTQHIREETGHDEWLRQDLAAIGRDPDEPLRRLPTATAATLVGAQYYWLFHYHPVCLLGHIAVVEGNPPAREVADLLSERSGLPLDGFRTLARHAALDIKHRDDLLRLVDTLPLTPVQETAIGLSALHTMDAVVQLFRDLADAFGPGARSTVPPVPVPAG